MCGVWFGSVADGPVGWVTGVDGVCRREMEMGGGLGWRPRWVG